MTAAIAGLVYLATLLAAPLVDPGTDVFRAYPEDYASGPAGALVRLGYAAVALMALAIARTLALGGRRAERIAAVLLAGGAAVSVFLAVWPQQVSGGPLLAGVFGLVLAPIVLSMAGRARLPAVVVALGVALTLGFLALAVAPRDVAGITNRAWDMLLAVWGVSFALARRRTVTPPDVGARA